MRESEVLDTPVLVVDSLYKTYVQWQRSSRFKDILKNLFFPQKKIIHALMNVSFVINQGEFVAYAGANGAGKSTTIKLLTGILQPSSGKINILGLNPMKNRIPLMNNIGVFFGQRTDLWWDHPVITSYKWKKEVWNIPEKNYNRSLRMVSELLELEDIFHTFARELSFGQRVRADLGMLLLHEPKILFLDEPTIGLDVKSKQDIINILKKINKENKTTIIITSHDMTDLEAMAERIILLSKGAVAFDGDFSRLREIIGGFKRITVTELNSEAPPLLSGVKLISINDNIYEYELLHKNVNLKDIFAELSSRSITDIEIKNAPIEDVILKFYRQHK